MICLLDINQIISHSVNKSEIRPALSEIAKLISLGIFSSIMETICMIRRVGLAVFKELCIVLPFY